MSITLGGVALSWIEVLGRWLFVAGAFLMIVGDAPPSLGFLSWPWLYLALIGASFVCHGVSGGLGRRDPEGMRWLYRPIAVLLGAFLVSSVFSQVPSLSATAFLLVAAIVCASWIFGKLLDDDRVRDAVFAGGALAVILLAGRVIAWRVDEGLDVAAFQILNNAWLGKLQLSWVFNLCAPLLLTRLLAEDRPFHAALHGVAWALAGVATYVLFSRMGMLVFGATTLVVCLSNPGYWRRWVPIVVTVVVLGGVLFARTASMTSYIVASLLDSSQNPGVAMRLAVFQDAIGMFLDHPVVGIGLGTFDDVAYAQPGTTANLDFYRNGWHAHNVFLHVLTETGVPGFLAWCYLWYAIVSRLWRAWRHTLPRARLDATAALCAVFAFLALSSTEVLIAARAHASLRMNLLIGLVVMLGLRITERQPPVGVETR